MSIEIDRDRFKEWGMDLGSEEGDKGVEYHVIFLGHDGGSVRDVERMIDGLEVVKVFHEIEEKKNLLL